MADEKELQEQPKKKGKLKWIILVVLLLLLAGGGFFAYKFFLAPNPDQAAQTEEAQATPEGEQPKEGVSVSLPILVVNLADPLGRRYLKIGMDVEVINEEAQAELNKDMPKIKDTLILLLSSKTFEQLSTLEDKMRLKEEVVNRLNQIIGTNKVLNVYITEMVVQ